MKNFPEQGWSLSSLSALMLWRNAQSTMQHTLATGRAEPLSCSQIAQIARQTAAPEDLFCATISGLQLLLRSQRAKTIDLRRYQTRNQRHIYTSSSKNQV
jgi:hypothetical protein